MGDWAYLNRQRVSPKQDPMLGTDPSAGFNGYFCLTINGLPIKCIVSDGGGWKHVSVSIHGSSMPPSWSIMCKIKDLFWEPEDWVVQFHPAHSEYVNQHPGVLHLWQPINADLPKPDRLMVGARDERDVEKIEANENISVLQKIWTRLAFNSSQRNK